MRPWSQLRAFPRKHAVLCAMAAALLASGIAANVAFHVADARPGASASGLIYPFNPFPEAFERRTQHFRPGGACYLVVHPGYVTYSEAGSEVTANPDVYGDYSEYLSNLQVLMNRLRKEDAIVICAIEERAEKNASLLPISLRPPDAALRIVTRNCSGLLQSSFTDWRGIRRHQELRPVIDFLKANSIEEIRVAGETAWYPGPNGYRGCLATLVSEFLDAGFRIRGVPGCVYPSIPLPEESALQACLTRDEWIADQWRLLYGGSAVARMAHDAVLRGIYAGHG